MLAETAPSAPAADRVNSSASRVKWTRPAFMPSRHQQGKYQIALEARPAALPGVRGLAGYAWDLPASSTKAMSRNASARAEPL